MLLITDAKQWVKTLIQARLLSTTFPKVLSKWLKILE